MSKFSGLVKCVFTAEDASNLKTFLKSVKKDVVELNKFLSNDEKYIRLQKRYLFFNEKILERDKIERDFPYYQQYFYVYESFLETNSFYVTYSDRYVYLDEINSLLEGGLELYLTPNQTHALAIYKKNEEKT